MFRKRRLGREGGYDTYTKNAQEGIRKDFKAMPADAVLDLVQDKLSGPEGIESLENDGSSHGTDEALPHGFVGKVVGYLLYREVR